MSDMQLDLCFEAYDQPNEAGAYGDCECIEMPSKKRGIRAEILVAFTPMGYIPASSAMVEDQGYGSYPNVCQVKSGDVYPSREDAVRKACAEIYLHMHKVGTTGSRAVMSWAKSMEPA